MVPFPVEFSPSAQNDLQDVLEYYADQGVASTGQRIVREIIAATRDLSVFPEMGRIVPEFDVSSLRELIRPPFRIVYRLGPDCISVVRIWRSERLLSLPDS